MKSTSNILIKQGAPELFEKKSLIFHVEYPSICNQKCPYCLEGNFSNDKIICKPWEKSEIIGAIDKIFTAYDESCSLAFIIAGGEPTIQPSFLELVKKLKSRKNTYQVVTTNFTKSIEYYKTLDIPLITSLHLDFHEPKEWIEKTIALKDLILETRIMAHPEKINKVKEAYDLFMKAKLEHNLSFSVEEICPFQIKGKNGKIISYNPEYDETDLKWIKNHLTERMPYLDSLQKKAGILKSMFYSTVSFYKNGEQKNLLNETKSFKNWFCERNLVVIKPDGTLLFGWYCNIDTGYNIFTCKTFPKNKLLPVICDKDVCIGGFGAACPKYKYINLAPKYTNKWRLLLMLVNLNIRNKMRYVWFIVKSKFAALKKLFFVLKLIR